MLWLESRCRLGMADFYMTNQDLRLVENIDPLLNNIFYGTSRFNALRTLS